MDLALRVLTSGGQISTEVSDTLGKALFHNSLYFLQPICLVFPILFFFRHDTDLKDILTSTERTRILQHKRPSRQCHVEKSQIQDHYDKIFLFSCEFLL